MGYTHEVTADALFVLIFAGWSLFILKRKDSVRLAVDKSQIPVGAGLELEPE